MRARMVAKSSAARGRLMFPPIRLVEFLVALYGPWAGAKAIVRWLISRGKSRLHRAPSFGRSRRRPERLRRDPGRTGFREVAPRAATDPRPFQQDFAHCHGQPTGADCRDR